MIDDFDYREDAEEPVRPSPLALAVLWSCTAVSACVMIAILLAVLSVLIGGHPWWLR